MKAIIMSHEDGGSYVMGRDGSFRFTKGHTKRPLGTEIEIVSQPARSFRTMVLAACFALFLMLGSFGIVLNQESYSVYADINPSVELVFNNLNQLKDAKPLNEDGAALLSGLKLKGNPAAVIADLIRAAELKGYLTVDDGLPGVYITVTARGGKSPEEYADIIAAAVEKNQMQDFVIVEVCDADFRDMAKELGVSPGKLKLAERLFASDQTTSIDEIVKMPVKDLMANIKEAEGKGVPENNSGNDNPSSPKPDNPKQDNPKQDNPNKGPENNSGNDNPSSPKPDNPNQDNPKPDNPNKGPENNSGNDPDNPKPDNPNKGPENNSGNDPDNPKPDNPNKGSENNSGNDPDNPKPDNPNKGPENNSGNPNPNVGLGNNNGNDPDNPKPDNPNKGPENNSGNDPDNPKPDNPNKGPGNNNGNQGNGEKEE